MRSNVFRTQLKSTVYKRGLHTRHTVPWLRAVAPLAPFEAPFQGLSPCRGYSAKARIPEKELLTENEDEGHLPSGELGRKKLLEKGFDPESFFEEKIVWGDLDSFRHVNNVRYVRFLESARISWMNTLGLELGGPERANDMLTGKGVSLILKDISVKFRRPVLYPDTLLIAHKPHDPHPTHFACAAAIWSLNQRTIVATSDSTLVWYDYDKLKKCDPGPETHAVLQKRIDIGHIKSS